MDSEEVEEETNEPTKDDSNILEDFIYGCLSEDEEETGDTTSEELVEEQEEVIETESEETTNTEEISTNQPQETNEITDDVRAMAAAILASTRKETVVEEDEVLDNGAPLSMTDVRKNTLYGDEKIYK